MREAWIKAVRALAGADIPGCPPKPMALCLLECFVAALALISVIALFLCMEPIA